ncbi:MAG: hypothetical protein AAFO84_00820 [Cyanobacteria bacterium J06598_1]
MTFATVLQAFLKDTETPKNSTRAWVFILVAALIWPITLPFIISSKLRASEKKLTHTTNGRLHPHEAV